MSTEVCPFILPLNTETYNVLAFGIFAGLLPSAPRFAAVRACVEGVQTYADSITVDGHKLLNVVSGLRSKVQSMTKSSIIALRLWDVL